VCHEENLVAVHATAIIHPSAQLEDNVTVGANAFIGENVQIGAGTQIGPMCVIQRDTKIGRGNRFFQFSSIGEDCQDKKYAGEQTYLEIGDNNIFRECTTIHRGTIQDKGITKIGSHNLLMAYCHVAHDCVLGDHNVLATNAILAGHVHLGDHVILGGKTAVHQFCHIGSHSFTAGGAIVLRDIPPYVMYGGNENKPAGINSEGLRRRGFDSESIMQIKRAYKVIYRQGLTVSEAIDQLRPMVKETPQIQLLIDFISNSSRGIVR
jgi:UDP-N-acetylglucosamine acyltransferase